MLKTERISGRNCQIEDYLEEPSLGPMIIAPYESFEKIDPS